MLSYRRKTPPTIILDPPVIAGVAAGLVVLCLLSFLLGRWSAGGEKPRAEPASAAGTMPEPEPIPVRRAEAGPTTPPMEDPVEEELSFVDRVEQDRVRQADSRPRQADAGRAAQPSDGSGAREDPATSPSLDPKPAASRPQDPAPGAADTGQPEAAEEGWVIQVFASESRQRATDLRDRLRRAGYPAGVAAAEVRGQMYYRVRVGPYALKATASSVARRLEDEEKLKTWISKS